MFSFAILRGRSFLSVVCFSWSCLRVWLILFGAGVASLAGYSSCLYFELDRGSKMAFHFRPFGHLVILRLAGRVYQVSYTIAATHCIAFGGLCGLLRGITHSPLGAKDVPPSYARRLEMVRLFHTWDSALVVSCMSDVAKVTFADRTTITVREWNQSIIFDTSEGSLGSTLAVSSFQQR